MKFALLLALVIVGTSGCMNARRDEAQTARRDRASDAQSHIVVEHQRSRNRIEWATSSSAILTLKRWSLGRHVPSPLRSPSASTTISSVAHFDDARDEA